VVSLSDMDMCGDYGCHKTDGQHFCILESLAN